MKKLLSVLAVASLVLMPVAYAADVQIEGGAKLFLPKDFDNGVGGEVKAVFPDVFAENVELSAGLVVFPTEAQKSDEDVDLVILPVEAGYKFDINETFSVKPVVGIDVYTGNKVDETVGAHVGADLIIATPVENLTANIGINYYFAEVEVAGIDNSFNGPAVDFGVNYKF